MAALDDLGIAGHDLDAGCLGGLGHGFDNGGQLRQRKALFQNEAGAEKPRLRAADRQVVDRAIHGQLADGAAGEEERLHDEGIGAHGERAAAQIEHSGVAQVLQCRIAEGGQKEMFDQFIAQLAAAAVAHHDGGITGERQRTGPVGEIRRDAEVSRSGFTFLGICRSRERAPRASQFFSG